VTGRDTMSCAEFRDDAADLALGHVTEPRRGELAGHAAACPACGRALADLATVSDRLLELAPEAEPPAGFEERVAGRLVPGGRWRGRTAPKALLAVAATTAAAVLVGLLAVTTLGGHPAGEVAADRSAPIVDREGRPVGTVELQAAEPARLIVTMDGPSDWKGVWTCEVLAGGEWVEVGSWTADEVTNGVWAAGIPASASDPLAMRILGGSGAVIAEADLRAR
jgi:hypothetical protein